MEKKNQLEEKMEFFHSLLVEMAGRVVDSAKESEEAFRKRDVPLYEKVKMNDAVIDQMRTLVESDGVRILISEAPYGSYLREVVGGMKIVTELERIGDIAVKFAAMANFLPFPEIAGALQKMTEADRSMAEHMVDALVGIDAEKARETAKMDDDVDALRTKAEAMVVAYEPATKEERVSLFRHDAIVKEMERFGDHITTICAWIVYMQEGVKPNLNP